MKKLKGVLLSLMLCCCLVVPIFAFTGCGGANPETVANSLKDLAGVFSRNNTVFVEGYIDNPLSLSLEAEKRKKENSDELENTHNYIVKQIVSESEGIKTKYKVAFGDNIKTAIYSDMTVILENEKTEFEELAKQSMTEEQKADFALGGRFIINSSTKFGYEELDRKYNVIFAYANEFIENYKIYLPKQEDEADLSDETKKALDTLNNNIKEYIDSINEFIKQKNITENYYNTTDFSVTTGLRSFERTYGTMVEKAVNVSSAMADVLEYNNIINYVKDFTATSDRTMIVEGFVRAKLLPVYSNFMLSEIKNKFWWESTSDEDKVTKAKITSLITKIEESFNSFKSKVKSATITEEKTEENISKVFQAVELKPLIENVVYVFVEDAKQFETALKELNIQKLSVDYKNDMAKYVKESNAFAENYLNKIDDFINLILDNFQNDFYGQAIK